MNFFEAQDEARKSSIKLLLLFYLSVIAIVILIDVTFLYLFAYNSLQTFHENFLNFGVKNHAYIAISVISVIALASLYKINQLRGGGHVIAEMLGGKLIMANTSDPVQRRLLNVVEEMAISSGVPVPQVYLLEDEGNINAFAAGFTTDDAVIGVTEGCLTNLDRDQLQGVIAHEFSHILNGDMQLNMRLMGILFGISFIGVLGHKLIRRAENAIFRIQIPETEVNVPVISLMVGIFLVVIGFVGTLFSNLIKASINRQREYLADASAVQFTRNPEGIAGALKLIGWSGSSGSLIYNPSAPAASHVFFANGIFQLFETPFSTHPPLRKRIKIIEPGWNGIYKPPKNFRPYSISEIPEDEKKAISERYEKTRAAMAITSATVLDQLNHVGMPTKEHMQQTVQLLDEIPYELRNALGDAFTARAVIFSMLLLDKDEYIREQQLERLITHSEQNIDKFTKRYYKIMIHLPRKYRLSLIDMAIPALKELSYTQTERFQENVLVLIKADKKVSIFEWAVKTILHQALNLNINYSQGAIGAGKKLKSVKTQTRLLLSAIAYSGTKHDDEAKTAFRNGAEHLGLKADEILKPDDVKFQIMEKALNDLKSLAPFEKKSFLQACIKTANKDMIISAQAAELIRVIATTMQVPAPPLLPS